jgi:hypothetical protein
VKDFTKLEEGHVDYVTLSDSDCRGDLFIGGSAEADDNAGGFIELGIVVVVFGHGDPVKR